jgi:phosphoribosyl-ATP pyrophosphohydrolase
MADGDIIARLFSVIKSRRGGDPETSYVAKRLGQGTHKIAQKLGEEAVECALAAVDGGPDEVTAESADLLFHLLLLWASVGISPDDVFAELARREGISGIAEKNARGR